MPSPRPLPSSLAQRAPRLARLRRRGAARKGPALLPLLRRSSAKPGSALPGGRWTRPLGTVVTLLLLGIGVRTLINQRLPLANQIERAARSQYIPQLERKLGQKIEVGRFSTDWLGRVHVENIVVGRNSRLPTGALIQAKGATLSLDILGLALGRTKFPDAVTGIDIDGPQVFLKRDARGKLNLTSLLGTSGAGTGKRWIGHVSFENGRAFYVDDLVKSRQNQTLRLDTRGVNGAIEVLAPQSDTSVLEFTGRIGQTLLSNGTGSSDLGAFPLRGRVASQSAHPARGWLETQTPVLSAQVLAPWMRSSPVDVRGGTLGGKIQVAFVGSQLAPRGDLALQGLSFLVPRPNAQAVEVRGLSGPLQFAGTALQTPGVSAQVAGAHWSAKGRVAPGERGVQDAVFDGDVSTRDFSLAGARALLPAGTLPPQLVIQSAGFDAHLSGTPDDMRANGVLNANSVSWNDAQGRRAAFPSLHAMGVLAIRSRRVVGLATRFEAINGTLGARVPLLQQASVNVRRLSGTLRGDGHAWNVDARADNWGVSATRGGTSTGQSAHLVASNTSDENGANWRGQVEVARASTAGMRLEALFPAASAIASSGELNGRARFSLAGTNWKRARLSGTVSLSSLGLSPSAIPPKNRGQIARVLGDPKALVPYLQARDVSADLFLGDGILRVSRAQAQTAAGPVRGALQTRIDAPLAPQFEVSAPALRLPPATLAGLARARGIELRGNFDGRGALRAHGTGGHIALDAVFRLNAPAFEARGARGGARIRGTNAVLNLSAGLNGVRPRWMALLRCDTLAATSGALGSTGVVVPPTLGGARAAGVQLVAASVETSRLVQLKVGAQRRSGNASAIKAPVQPKPGDQLVPESARLFAAQFNSSQNVRVQLARDAAQSNARPPRRVALPSRSTPGANPWTMSVTARRVAIRALALAGQPIVSVRDVAALGQSVAGGITLPRVGFGWGASGRVDGALRLDKRGLSGQVLARSIEAATLEGFAPQNARLPRLRGLLQARATLSPGVPTRIEALLARGSVALPRTGNSSGALLPLRDFGFGVEASAREVRLLSANGFVGGARVQSEGTARLAAGQIGARVRVAGLSLAPYAAMFGVAKGAGLLRADLRVRFDTRLQTLELGGQTHLDGGAYRGASLDRSDAQIGATWNLRSRQATLRLANWSGRLEGAPFSGSLALDTARNSWSADLAATNMSLLRLARLNARLQNASATSDELGRLTAPIEGVAGGQLSMSGTLFGPNGRRFAPRPLAGFARLSVPRLGWQAKTIGALDGTFNLAGGRVEFAPLLLHPVEGEAGQSTPSLSLLGSVPIARNGGPLDVRLSVGEAPLGFFAASVIQGRDALGTTGFDSPFLNSAATYAANLPRGLQGRVALEATLGGTFTAPVIRVSRLTLRDGRAPLPLGGLSLPATLDAAFTLQKGEITFERGQFRLAKAERDPGKAPVAGASPPPDKANSGADDGDEDDDTLVQIQSGARLSLTGQSSLVADVLNANLSQLAPWVPALRGTNGEALLKGQLEGFSVRVEGPATNPRVTGSVEAQNIAYRGRSIERLRVARFDIGGGFARIEPGNLTVKEGRFESSAASGSVAWDWKRLGPAPDGALQLQFPLATRDFGALAALLVPQLADARADEFSGLVEVGGTINSPQFQGNIALKNAGFRLASSPGTPIALGIGKLSGALRFQDGNRLVIDPANPLSGELVSPEPPPAPKATSGKKSKTKTTTSAPAAPPFQARGAFGLRGAVTLNAPNLSDALADLPSTLAGNVYDLRFDLTKGALDAPPTSGLRDAVFSASFRTENLADAAHSQVVRWLAAARGQSLSRKIGAGELLSRGALRLRPDFASGFSSLSRSNPLAWSLPTVTPETGDLSDSDAARRLKESDFVSARPQLVLRAFAAKATGYGSGVVDGRLFLDKGAARAPLFPGARVQNVSLAQTQSKGARLFGSWRGGDTPRPIASATRNDAAPLLVADEGGGSDDVPLRVGGDLTVSDAQIVGAGSGGDGQVTRLSLLPDAPRLDVRLTLGKSVEIVNSAIRARLAGDLGVTGTPSNPLLLGTVSMLDGQVRFPNARARVEQGSVLINVGRDPETDLPRTRLDVDALARGQSGRYTVTLRLRGPLNFDARGSQNGSNLQVDVSSNPPLSQDEAFSQLLGLAPRGFSNGSGGTNVALANQAYAQAVLQLVAAPFFSGFERSVAQALGLSSVSFEYRFNEPLAFEVSKAIGDRVMVSYRRTLGPTQISAGRIPYELRIDYRIKGDYFVGIKTDERGIRTLTLQKSYRF